jgi:hypothetical protein
VWLGWWETGGVEWEEEELDDNELIWYVGKVDHPTHHQVVYYWERIC